MHVKNKENDAMNRLITINGRQIYGFRFRSLDVADRFAHNATQPQRVILGDHPEIWVVTPADAEILVKAGYEYAN